MATTMRLMLCPKSSKNLDFFAGHVVSSRCLCSSGSGDPYSGPNSGLIGPYVHNRNPRNLERMRIAMKPEGYWLESPGRNHWHRLYLERSNQHTTGCVKHFSGKEVVSASTKEWCIKKQLHSTNDVSACLNVGRVLAQRCLESGITEMYCEYSKDTTSSKIKSFLEAMEDGGISLQEPPRYFPDYNRLEKDAKPWEVTEESVVSTEKV